MENKILKAFELEDEGSTLVGCVAESIVNRKIFASLRSEIYEKEGDLIGEYSFFYLAPTQRSILNVSNIVSVFYDLTYNSKIETIEDLKKNLQKNEDRLHEEKARIEMSGFGFDVIGFFLSDFTQKLFKLGIIEESQVLEKGYNYANIELYEQ